MNELEQKEEYLQSLKSLETENYIDRIFYRPLGYWIACHLRGTGITPNVVTIISIIVGMTGAALFYFIEPWWMVLLAILGMVLANILDCVDGQLARLTGITSKWGRILDGAAGDLWFITLYTALSLRMYHATGEWYWFLIAFLSLLCHLSQASLTDLYKTFHLAHISEEKGKEFETYAMIQKRLKQQKPGFSKLTLRVYAFYTGIQAFYTPELQKLVDQEEIADLTPEDRKAFRLGSRIVMKLVDLMTFNGRTIPLFILALMGQVWCYFLYEIIFLSIVFWVARGQHELLCRSFRKQIR